mmetsp:Transcript_23815/g.37235  ORF Transcript_23815/g.37235 Transcript_23815/m.37235 type:complete len:207 (-) Transcript_23815:71-691(-)|eukprot:CAMPEP_0184294506 /NCGR_PEP_ID=MMETSP1049-20130417/5684_1 /TAXON_ID=77928 /ORGANISM="Proteomonas sulcata, Strain CCMP704" /LENGTH=206 /DNA_ID=CAMNT_0026602819 /DNA_START=481 /DNA_END=1101 /DNA_ORIENTATION=+
MEMNRASSVLMLMVVAMSASASPFAAAFSPGVSGVGTQIPAMLRGRSAPSRPIGENARLRMTLANSNLEDGMREIPKDCGIDPVTGQVVAGDPSLVLNTNVDLGAKKMDFMKAASKAVAAGLGKPESYVAVVVADKQDMIWGGSEEPCAVGNCYSLGSINLENNKKVQAELTQLLDDFGVAPNRIYVNYWDVPRENCGYNGATFAG